MEESFNFNANSFLATIYKPTMNYYDATIIIMKIIITISKFLAHDNDFPAF